MSKHTPGPWRINGGLPDGEIKPESKSKDINLYRLLVEDADGVPIALLFVADLELAQGKADARLIAAGPDLLSAAHATLKLWKKHGMGENHHESGRVFDMLTAAIAKAEGRNDE